MPSGINCKIRFSFRSITGYSNEIRKRWNAKHQLVEAKNEQVIDENACCLFMNGEVIAALNKRYRPQQLV